MTPPPAAERLSRACRALDVAGVIAREDFGWGRGDGLTLMYGEREKHFPGARGFVHDAVDRGPGLLFFGVFTDQPEQDPEDQAAIGREVVEALRAQGLDPAWNGSPRQAVSLTESAWAWSDPQRATDGEPVVLEVHIGDERLDGGGLRRGPGHVLATDRVWRELLYRLTPATHSFATFITPDGEGSVQMVWGKGPRLRMEIPDPAERVYRFTHVTLAQAERVVAALAEDGRQILGDFGELEVEAWG